MVCDKRKTGQVTFTVTLTADSHSVVREPALLLEKLKSMVGSKAIATFDAWTVQVDSGSYEPYRMD